MNRTCSSCHSSRFKLQTLLCAVNFDCNINLLVSKFRYWSFITFLQLKPGILREIACILLVGYEWFQQIKSCQTLIKFQMDCSLKVVPKLQKNIHENQIVFWFCGCHCNYYFPWTSVWVSRIGISLNYRNPHQNQTTKNWIRECCFFIHRRCSTWS